MNKSTKIIGVLIAVAIAMYLLYNYIKNKKTTETAAGNNFASGGSGSGSSGGSNWSPIPNIPENTVAPNSPNYPVRSLQSPYQKGADITEMQKSYNRVVQMRINKNANSPVWAKISADGVFGPQTSAAMQRMMQKSEVKLNEVLGKEQIIKFALNA